MPEDEQATTHDVGEPSTPPLMHTPEEWAKRLGHVCVAPEHMPQLRTHYDWRHAVADALHGWSQHAYHYQAEPLLLTETHYCAALDAAAEYPTKPAHVPAFGRTKKEGV